MKRKRPAGEAGEAGEPKIPVVRAGKDYWWRSGWVRGGWYVPQTAEEKELLRVCGTYHWERNRFGITRDHIFPRAAGFRYNVFPQLLRHPANCRFIPAPDKQQSDPLEIGEAQAEDLCRRIEGYAGDWPEHTVCLNLVMRWRRGERYDWSKEPVTDSGWTAEPIWVREPTAIRSGQSGSQSGSEERKKKSSELPKLQKRAGGTGSRRGRARKPAGEGS